MTTDPATLAADLDAVDETGHACDPNHQPAPNYNVPDYNVPNYNVAPTTTVATVVARHHEPGDQPTRRLRLMRWGLLPGWVKADADGRPLTKSLLINARAETLTDSPAFRAAAAHKRCLIPMDGYYEWMPNPDVAGRKARKTPFYMHRTDGRPLLVAGLWSVWQPHQRGGDSGSAAPHPVLSCTVVTTDAPGELGRVHDRMPLLLTEPDADRWLDPDSPAPSDLLNGTPDIRDIAIRQVSTLVNSIANNGPELISPARPDDGFNQPVVLF